MPGRLCKCECDEAIVSSKRYVNKEHQLNHMRAGEASRMNALQSAEAKQRGGASAGRFAADSGRLAAGADEWARNASSIAPTLVGGSKKHGGADLGPTRAKRQWAVLGVDGLGVADAAPGPGFKGVPKLTVRQASILKGFPEDWTIQGRKTAAYRQVGNAFPAPVAEAVAGQILTAFVRSAICRGLVRTSRSA